MDVRAKPAGRSRNKTARAARTARAPLIANVALQLTIALRMALACGQRIIRRACS
jgi:hypothetical protein